MKMRQSFLLCISGSLAASMPASEPVDRLRAYTYDASGNVKSIPETAHCPENGHACNPLPQWHYVQPEPKK